jgi:hypothetical protein
LILKPDVDDDAYEYEYDDDQGPKEKQKGGNIYFELGPVLGLGV